MINSTLAYLLIRLGGRVSDILRKSTTHVHAETTHGVNTTVVSHSGLVVFKATVRHGKQKKYNYSENICL
jgi:hypothetical protein